MPTPRLYFEDARLATFEAKVSGVARFGDWPSIILDKTAFYPEAGGQMADRGALLAGERRFEVIDVQVDDDGIVHHRLAGDPALAPEIAVQGLVDLPRRIEHTALHTGQHMLSRALLSEANAATVSARLGETACTIDLDRPSLDEAAIARAESLVNAVIDDDRTIRAFFPTPEELASLELRRAPKVDHDIRVVAIDGFDVSPCGGTHCTRTSQVALVKVTGLERYKGKVRLSFVAGRRARRELGEASTALSALAKELSTSPSEIAVGLQKLRAELSTERARSQALTGELAGKLGDELVRVARAAGKARVVATIPDASVELLRRLAGHICAALNGEAMLAGDDGQGRPVVFSRHAGAALDCGRALKAVAMRGGGRGGGRPEHAEGRLPQNADLEALVSAELGAQPGETR